MKLIKVGNRPECMALPDRRVAGVFGGRMDTAVQIASAGLMGGGALVYLGGGQKTGGTMTALGTIGLVLSMIGGDNGDGDGGDVDFEEDLREPINWGEALFVGSHRVDIDGVQMLAADVLDQVSAGDEIVLRIRGDANFGESREFLRALKERGVVVKSPDPLAPGR